ncbi:MAG: hypothetical protein ACE5Q3_14560 [Alphaproteobacteria bacterium]
MTEDESQALDAVTAIYEAVMAALPDGHDPIDVLAALTLALKDVALAHHGNLYKAQEASVLALDKSFVMEARRYPSKAVH